RPDESAARAGAKPASSRELGACRSGLGRATVGALAPHIPIPGPRRGGPGQFHSDCIFWKSDFSLVRTRPSRRLHSNARTALAPGDVRTVPGGASHGPLPGDRGAQHLASLRARSKEMALDEVIEIIECAAVRHALVPP